MIPYAERSTMTISEYALFAQDYKLGKFPHQRYGQAFINFASTLRVKITDSELFYEENRQKAKEILLTKYVDQNS